MRRMGFVMTAAHGTKLLVATQSGQGRAFDWREGNLEEPLFSRQRSGP